MKTNKQKNDVTISNKKDELQQLKDEIENMKIAFSMMQQHKSKRTQQKEVSDYFIRNDKSNFEFKNLNEVAKYVEQHSENYLILLTKRLNKEKLTSLEFKQELVKDLNKLSE